MGTYKYSKTLSGRMRITSNLTKKVGGGFTATATRELVYELTRCDSGGNPETAASTPRATFEDQSKRADDHMDKLLARMSPDQLRSLGPLDLSRRVQPQLKSER